MLLLIRYVYIQTDFSHIFFKSSKPNGPFCIIRMVKNAINQARPRYGLLRIILSFIFDILVKEITNRDFLTSVELLHSSDSADTQLVNCEKWHEQSAEALELQFKDFLFVHDF